MLQKKPGPREQAHQDPSVLGKGTRLGSDCGQRLPVCLRLSGWGFVISLKL